MEVRCPALLEAGETLKNYLRTAAEEESLAAAERFVRGYLARRR